MKSLWDISWSQYSWWERWQIFKEYFVIYNHIVDISGDGIMPAPLNSNILHIIAKSTNLELAKKIIDVENITEVDEENRYGWTALHVATHFGNLDFVKFLIEVKGANTKAKAQDKYTAIDISVRKGNFEITKYFIEEKEEPLPVLEREEFGSFRPIYLCDKLYKYFYEKGNSEEILTQIENLVKEACYEEGVFNHEKGTFSTHPLFPVLRAITLLILKLKIIAL